MGNFESIAHLSVDELLDAGGDCVNNDDPANAVRYYTVAALKGNDVLAQCMLGLLYDVGEGVEQDNNKAVYWLKLAAEQGDDSAQYHYGKHIYRGDGLRKDLSEGAEWFRKAAEQGHSGAQRALAYAYYYGDGVPTDYVRAVEWAYKAATQDDEAAQYLMGICYQHGRGVEQNYSYARYYLEQARQNGDEDAQDALNDLARMEQGLPPLSQQAAEVEELPAAAFARRSDGYYYIGTCGARNGDYVDVTFADGARQTVRVSDLVGVADGVSEMSVQGNWKRHGKFYPCQVTGIDKDYRFNVRYTQDGFRETVDLDQLRLK